MAGGIESVSTLWLGRPLSPFERLCLTSFVRAGLRVQVFTFDDRLDMPEGVDRLDARDVLPETSAFENPRERGSYAMYANRFRYRLLQLCDTTWIDADVLFVSRFPEDPYLFGFENPVHVNVAVLRAPRDSPFIAFLADTALATDPRQVVWGQLGPKLATEAVARFGLRGLVQPRQVLYPLHHSEVWKLFDPAECEDVSARLHGASSLHLWNEILRRAPRPVKAMRPPAGSFLADAFVEHGIDVGALDALDARWVATEWRRALEPEGGPAVIRSGR